MEDIKLRLNTVVAAQLSAAPQSDTKDELIEELSDNLYRRYLDMTGAGVPEEEAFRRASDDLGDVDELLAYLGVEPAAVKPDAAVNSGDSQTQVKTENGQTRITTQDGQTITINHPDSAHIVINTDDKTTPAEPNSRQVSDAARAEAEAAVHSVQSEAPEAPQSEAEAEAPGTESQSGQEGDGPKGWTDQHGDVHHDFSGEIPQSDLDAILANVSEMCRVAADQAKEAVRQAKEAIKRRTTVERDDHHVKVNFNTHPNAPTPPTPPTPPAPPTPPTPPAPPTPPTPPTPPAPPAPPEPPEPPKGWGVELELDSDQGRFYAAAGPKDHKDVLYGFGYDKAKGGFYTQWGEGPVEDRTGRGPYFTGEQGSASYMEHQDDGSYSVTALKDLRGISVHTNAGDVSIHVSEAPDAGVIIDGDVDDLDVTCSADGVLTIREGRTASSSFFSRRGIGSADVELYLPSRHWEMIHVTTASGDVEIDKDGLDIDDLTVQTASGDLNVRLWGCGHLYFKSASGDLDMEGNCANLHAETISGDVTLRGQVEDAVLKSTSGDIELEGVAARFLARTISGDVNLETSVLPQALEMASKSGDCCARIPDAGPFTLRMMTTSGEIDCGFPMNYVNGMFVYGDGSGPAYSLTTISGDVSLERY